MVGGGYKSEKNSAGSRESNVLNNQQIALCNVSNHIQLENDRLKDKLKHTLVENDALQETVKLLTSQIGQISSQRSIAIISSGDAAVSNAQTKLATNTHQHQSFMVKIKNR